VITFEFQDEVPPVKLDSRPSLVVVHLYPADKQLEDRALGARRRPPLAVVHLYPADKQLEDRALGARRRPPLSR